MGDQVTVSTKINLLKCGKVDSGSCFHCFHLNYAAMTILLLPYNICSEEFDVVFLLHLVTAVRVSAWKKPGLCLLFPTSYSQIL